MERLSDRWMYYCGILAGTGMVLEVDDLKRIQNLIDAEEQGLLLKLPCKVGDTIYRIGTKCDFDDVPKDFNCDITDCDKCFYGNEYVIREIKANHFHIRQFMEGTAKYTFLTKAEAENALEEMEK